MTIEPVTTADTESIYRIAHENGLPASWVWPVDCHGGVAKENGRVVAFCAIKELWDNEHFLAYQEFWCEQTSIGHTGLFVLGKELESIAQRLANERNIPMKAGGFVHRDRDRHARALKKRGYEVEGEILTKTFHPQEKAQVA